MPKRVKQITFPDGITRTVEELNFDIIKEDWHEYQLDAGVLLKFKAILKKVYWVLDESGNRMYTSEGDPFILITSTNQVTASE